MAATYGQLVHGKRISYTDFKKEVANGLRRCIGNDYKLSEKECKKLYNKGYSIENACSFLILNS